MWAQRAVLVLVVALCVSELVAARHVETRDISSVVKSARAKLLAMLTKVEDAAKSGVETTFGYMARLEDRALDAASARLGKMGIDVDLRSVVDAVRGNLTECARDETIRTEAKNIGKEVLSCVTKDVGEVMKIITDMRDVWQTAKKVPDVMIDVANQCKAHAEEDNHVADDINTEPESDEKHDLDEEVAQVINHLMLRRDVSKRELWNIKRITNCIKAVYNLSKSDLVSMPGKIIGSTARAYRIYQGAQVGIPACAAAKIAENIPGITRMTSTLASCVVTNMG